MRAQCVVALAIAAVLAASLSGCRSGAPADDGPLSSADHMHDPIPGGSICTPYGGPQTDGFVTFTNFGGTTVTLDRVVLLRPRNQRLLGSYAVPGVSAIGNPHGWPPKDRSYWPPGWKDRKPVRGFRVAPGRTFNMALGVAPITSARSTDQGMLVYYHDSSGDYVAKSYWAMIIGNLRGC